MKIQVLLITALAALLAGPQGSQDIAGKWQGTLHQGQKDLRIIVKIEKAPDGTWSGRFYNVDAFPDWGAFTPVTVTLQSATVKLELARGRGTYEGNISADGNSIEGTLNQGQPQPLNFARATPATEWKDPSPHKMQFLTVDNNVKLEVLDWGGTGRPLVLLAGGGATAHSYDAFAPKFTSTHHVYAITRRGFGDSSRPTTGYLADRLGDDVIAVLDALKLDRPVLAGLSIAGEELSSVGSRHPERVAGLIYLDAAYPYAYYDSSRGDTDVDIADLRRKLAQLQVEESSAVNRALVKELLEKDLPQFEKDLQKKQKELEADPSSPSDKQVSQPAPEIFGLMFGGFEKYTRIPVPILAIYAYPHAFAGADNDPKKRAALEAEDRDYTGAQADAFERAVPSAKVVRLPHAQHNLVRFHEAEVIKEMNAFMSSLK